MEGLSRISAALRRLQLVNKLTKARDDGVLLRLPVAALKRPNELPVPELPKALMISIPALKRGKKLEDRFSTTGGHDASEQSRFLCGEFIGGLGDILKQFI